ncbi:MAG: ribbon-helix-helix protein, CopG family [Nitrosopumilus sp.]|nr:ribbon-helix-helix protein, CopG family [Nitrosopumilus sp.]
MANSSTLISVRVSQEIATRLDNLAFNLDRSKSFVAAEAIEEYLDLHEWQVQAIHDGVEEIKQGQTINLDDIKKQWTPAIEH